MAETVLDAAFFVRWMTAAAAAIDREADRLTELDSAIGDADHGRNMQRGFAAVVKIAGGRAARRRPVRC